MNSGMQLDLQKCYLLNKWPWAGSTLIQVMSMWTSWTNIVNGWMKNKRSMKILDENIFFHMDDNEIVNGMKTLNGRQWIVID